MIDAPKILTADLSRFLYFNRAIFGINPIVYFYANEDAVYRAKENIRQGMLFSSITCDDEIDIDDR